MPSSFYLKRSMHNGLNLLKSLIISFSRISKKIVFSYDEILTTNNTDTMRKNILIFLVIILTFTSCHQSNVKITGEIKDGGKQKVYLEQLNVDHAVLIDSTQTNKNGKFSFKTSIEQPTFYSVRVGAKEIITIIAVPDEKIELSGTLKGLSHNYWVDGSENSLWIKLLNFQLHHSQTALDSLKKKYLALPAEPEYAAQRQELSHAWDSVINKQVNFSKDFILKHAVSPASYYALYQRYNNNDFVLTPELDLHTYKIVASSLKAMYPESQYTMAILKHLDQINKNLRSEKLRQFIANSETQLPGIRLPNINGDTISLNSLKDKYIILDFTVLGAQGGKEYIQEMKKIYNKFRNKGVQIYQVCLDENRLSWQNFVRQNQIDWICVWDEQALQSHAAKAWNIQTVPANYIINRKSEIVGKNLTGKRLDERLTDLLK